MRWRRIGLVVVTAGMIAMVTVHAQIPGRNVNMVSGTGWPIGDPFLQRQNEGSVAASSRNPLHLLGGSNDYRSVDVPGLLGIDETGDAWLGLYKSFDGGQRWTSTLLPGYPYDSSPDALTSPLRGYQAGADAVVRAGAGGMFYFSGMVFDRVENGKSAIFVARFIDNNNKEDGDPIKYLGASLVATATGVGGVSYDKPWMAVDIPRSGAGTCRIVTPNDTGGSITQRIPAGNVYVAYTAISGVGVNTRSQIYFTRSTDCGATWSTPVRISRTEDPINQGATIAIDPRNGNVSVAWRRFGLELSPDSDSMVVVRSLNQGRSFERPNLTKRLQKFSEWLEKHPRTPAQLLKLLERIFEHRFKGSTPADVDNNISEFDQVMSEDMIRFRTNAYPTMVFDGDGRLYIAWAERGYGTARPSATDGDARIVMTTTTDAVTFTPTFAVNDGEIINGQAVHLPGHQLMPSLTFAGGKLMLVYFDLRDTRSQVHAKWIDDRTAIDFGHDPITGLPSRHTVDIRAVMGTPGPSPVFDRSVKVSDYIQGIHPTRGLEDLQANPPNFPMFRIGTVPFIGDYIDIQPAPSIIPLSNGGWGFNTAATPTLPVFHTVWTDNRDVRPPLDFNWKNYAPPTFVGPSPLDPTRNVPQCLPGTNPGSRNQNIYTARITGGLLVGSPGNSKQLSPTLQRSFVVFVQNNTQQTRAFRFTIQNQPIGGRASFSQFPQPPYTAQSPPPLIVIDAVVPPRSTASRTVYATSTNPRAPINVDVVEIGLPGGAPPVIPLGGTVVLNPDLANPDLANPDYANPDLANPDLANAEVATPDLANPDLANPDLANFLVMTPDLANPDLANVVVANPDLANPDLANPDLANPDLANPDLANPDLANPDLANAVVTDITWQIQNKGNTTSAFNVNLFLAQTTLPAGFKVQLILRKVYKTPVVVDCALKFEARNILVANIRNPEFLHPSDPALPDLNEPSAEKNATMPLAPGEIGQITIRVLDADKSNNIFVDPDGAGPQPPASIDPILNPVTSVTPVVRTQPVPTEEVEDGQTKPQLVTPTGTHVLFVQPPVNAVAGNNMVPPVTVQVRDGTGTVIPNALVTLTFQDNPAGAVLSGNAGVLTNAQGIAVFPALQIDRVGFGYSLKATATVAATGFTGSGLTNPFAVTEACVATGVATLQRYHVDGPAWPDRPKFIKAGVDWNQDGLEDVVVVTTGGTFYTMPNVAGGFSAGYIFATPTGVAGATDVATGDFNGDGAPDVAIAKGTQKSVVFQPLALGLPNGSPVVRSVVDDAMRLAAGDFNNDTHLDLAVLRPSSVRILYGDNSGSFPTTFVDVPGLSLATAIATLDLDNDDDLDLVVADSPGPVGNIRIFRNHPTGVFTAMAPSNVGDTPMHLAVKDFNSDGYPDIAVAHAATPDVTVLFGDAAGDYSVSSTVPVGFVSGGLTAGDYNTDGVFDLALTNTAANALTIWFGQYGPPFTFANPQSFATDPQPIGITTGDFNNDGRSDLATANNGASPLDDFNTMSVLLGTCGAQTADLEVTQTESADPVAPAGQITYTATVTNHGPFPATNVRLVQDATSTAPNLVWQGAVVTPQGSCTNVAGGPALVCDLGTIASGASVTVESIFVASDSGSIRSVFTAMATEVDRAPENNRDAETTAVQQPGYLVTNTNDAGAGSFRQAILDANAHPGSDTILFNIPGAAPHTIAPLSALPAITEALLIDAPTTGNCAGAPPTIEIDGVSAGASSGLVASVPGVTIRGLSITRFSELGIVLSGGSGVVECSYLGLAPDGVTAKGNGIGGILVASAGNTIGGASAAVRNVISGNTRYGIRISGPGPNVVQGNFIGTDAAGTAARANRQGIELRAANTTIGGLTAVPGAGVGNVISGNSQDGIEVVAPGAVATNIIQGNIIGLGADGVTPLGNDTGVSLLNSAAQIGGTLVGARNVISSNNFGIILSNSGSTRDTFIQGNSIGVDITGTLQRANSIGVSVGSAPGTRVGGTAAGAGNIISGNQTGVFIFAGSHPVIDGLYNATVQGNLIGVQADGVSPLGNGTGVRVHNDNNLIGGVEPGAGNTIAFSTGAGVDGAGIEVRTATGVTILSNAIVGNAWLGIDLEHDGPTANDPLDADGGANLRQNFPVITAATSNSGVTTVSGYLRSTPGTAYTIQIFANNAGNIPQGHRLLDTLSETSDAAGFVAFGLSPAIALGEAITATATDPAGNTSEFSPGVTTVNATAFPIAIDTTALPAASNFLVESGGVQVISPTAAGGITSAMLAPGSYTFHSPWASTTAAFDFLVQGDGLLDFSAALDGYVSGRGTATLTVSGRPVTIDTTAMKPRHADGLTRALVVSSFNTNTVSRFNGESGAPVDTITHAALVGSAGVAYGPDGHLYVAGQASNNVLRFDGDTGAFIDEFVSAGSGGLSVPTGITFGGNGALYVSSLGTHEVLKYDVTTGAFLGAFVAAGSGGLDQPMGIAFGPDERFYVASSIGDSVLVYDGDTGAFIDAFVPAGGGGLDSPAGLTFGPDGNLYVASGSSDSVLRYDAATGAFIDAFVAAGSGGLDDPVGLAFGPDSNLYVATRSRVLRYNGTTGALVDVFVPSGSGGVNRATFITFRPGPGLPNPGHYLVWSDGVPGIAITLLGDAQHYNLLPGTYTLSAPWASESARFDFRIDPSGTFDFAPALDSYVSGRGTSTLVVSGHPITFDTKEHDPNTQYIVWSDNAGGGDSPAVNISPAGSIITAGLLPGNYRFALPWASTTTAFSFEVRATGTVDFSSALDGYVTGRGTSTLRVLGHAIGIDTTGFDSGAAYTIYSGSGAAVANTFAGGLEPAHLMPGSYRFFLPWAATTTAFDFTVDAAGTIDFDHALDGYVTGRGTSTLTVLGHPIGIDTTGFDSGALYTVYSGGAPAVGLTAAGGLKSTRLLPGSYRFSIPWSSNVSAFDFTVSAAGLIDFDPSLDGFVSGRGTNTLTVSGHSIGIDTTGFDSGALYTVYAAGAPAVGITAAGGLKPTRLLPGTYSFYLPWASNTATFDFTVSAAGTIDFAAAHDAYVSGRGTGTLTVLGYAIGIDTTGFDAAASYTVYSGGAPAVGITAAGSLKSTRLLPGSYSFSLPWASNTATVDFTVTAAGTVDFSAAVAAYVSGAGTSTLDVNGWPITIDTTSLSSSTYTIWSEGAVAVGATATGGTAVVRLLPGTYLFDGTFDFTFSVLADGTIDFSAAFEPDLEGRGTNTLTVNNDPNTDADDSYVVTTTADSGAGSLRQAILDANAHAGADTITFNIAGAGPHTIAPTSTLPSVTDPVTIDGTSQPGYAGLPKIEIRGDSVAGAAFGLTLVAGNSVVKGLAINRFVNSGIRIQTGGGNGIYGNIIGLDPTGAAVHGNALHGVDIRNSSGNIIGSGAPSGRNIISGNSFAGVFIENAANNTVSHNFIGLDVTGTADLGNTNAGVLVTGTSPGNQIGLPGGGNVIAGNGGYGVTIHSSDNTVRGNKIGTNAAGAAGIANQGGIGVWSTSANTVIGGTGASDGNLISGNTEYGISIIVSTTATLVQGNRIGTNAAGTGPIANANGILVAGTNHTIGGSASGAGNLISGNTLRGVYVVGPGTSGNVIAGNTIGLAAGGSSALGNGTNGVVISEASGNHVGGPVPGERNVISGNSSTGILIMSTGGATNGNSVENNYIGTDALGTSALPNGAHGIEVLGSAGTVNATTIGGTGANAGNLISGNQSTGVRVAGASADGTIVAGNRIGTSPDGLSPLGNGASGVEVQAAPNTVIGGTIFGSKNLISGNGGAGILLTNAPAFAVRANWIGADGNGTSALPNAVAGVLVAGGGGAIGGFAAARNLISGNAGPGVWITSGDSIIIDGNSIGLAASGTAALGNSVGVQIDGGPGVSTNIEVGDTPGGQGNVISGNGVGILARGGNDNRIELNLIGTSANGAAAVPNTSHGVHLTSAGAGSATGYQIAFNTIAFNGGDGVRVSGAASAIRISSAMHSNGGLGINLVGGTENGAGVTENDFTFSDGDAGPNGLLNYPFNVSVKKEAGQTRVSGTFESAPGGTYTIHVYASTSCDPSGNGEGQRFIGSFAVSTGGGHTVVFDQLLGGVATFLGEGITLTAIDAAGNTSEFSSCVILNETVVTTALDGGPGSLRAAILETNLAIGATPTISFNIAGGAPHVIALSTALPPITRRVLIDATSEPGYDFKPVVELSGAGLAAGAIGFDVDAGSTTIRGFSITRFPGFGIFLRQAQVGHSITSNYIGTDRLNTAGKGNGGGIRLRASASTVDFNVIASNTDSGILMEGGQDNIIQANKIGTSDTGMAALPNIPNGITMFDGTLNALIQNNQISANQDFGIDIQHSGALAPVTGTRIFDNNIGLRGDGSFFGFGPDLIGDTSYGPPTNFGPVPRGNRKGGIRVNNAPGTLIGDAFAGNAISGNTGAGIELLGQYSPAPIIRGNRIGLDSSGSRARGNSDDGIRVATAGAVIGGSGMSQYNVISANINDGIITTDALATGLQIVNNLIGLNSAGNDDVDADGLPFGNGKLINPDPGCCHSGVTLATGGNTVTGNVISNNMVGVRSSSPLEGPGNTIDTNMIGADADENPGFANTTGVLLVGDQGGTTITSNLITSSHEHAVLLVGGTSGAVIGSDGLGGNTIRANGVGIAIGADATAIDAGNEIKGRNIIEGSTGLGIDLGNDGVTANDPNDTDAGPNTLQNYPVILGANNAPPTQLIVNGTFNSTPSTLFTLRVYASSVCNASGSGEGEVYIGSFTVTTDNTGNTPFIQAFNTADLPNLTGWQATMTATGPGGHTSEFSACRPIP